MVSGSRGELPETPVLGLEVQGSFDSVAASLREPATPLRMTVCFRDRIRTRRSCTIIALEVANCECDSRSCFESR
jgi:hypothetical protein